MHIHLVPDGGLCNRMRAVDSAIALARDNNWRLTVHWRRHRGILNCRFDRLFEPISGLEMREVGGMPIGFEDTWLSRTVRTMRCGLAIGRKESMTLLSGVYDRSVWERYKALYIISYVRFHPNSDQYAEFRAAAGVRERVDRETADFTGDTIGMHIRRTDNEKSIEHSPLERFESAIELELERNGSATFYVASDSVETKAHLRRKYGTRILCNEEQADRDSEAGIVQAAVELYSLARTKRIYGSHWSSFSHTAAHLGRIPEFTVLKDEFKLAE